MVGENIEAGAGTADVVWAWCYVSMRPGIAHTLRISIEPWLNKAKSQLPLFRCSGLALNPGNDTVDFRKSLAADVAVE